MRDFLSRAKQLHEKGAYRESGAQIQDVLDAAFKDLKPVQAKSQIAYKNVEELFSAIDMGRMLGVFGSRDPSTLEELGRSIKVFIYRTIEETVRIPLNEHRIGQLEGYGMLAKLALERVKAAVGQGRDDVSFITFNYDTCLEFALVRNGVGVDYGLAEAFLDPDENQYRTTLPVLKLHGSINWASCPQCQTIVPTRVDPWRRASLIELVDQPGELRLLLGSQIAGQVHRCGARLDPVPFLVPPTWDKATGAADLKRVWQRAARELGSASNVVVIGYSMPSTDTFFRYLFALGSNSDVHLDRFVLINGNSGAQHDQRFRELLGPMAADGFDPHPIVFSGAENLIRNVLS
jgi:hypothetical protein